MYLSPVAIHGPITPPNFSFDCSQVKGLYKESKNDMVHGMDLVIGSFILNLDDHDLFLYIATLINLIAKERVVREG